MGELRWGERVITTPVKINTPSSILPRHEGEVDVLRALLRLACQVEHNFSLNTNRDLFAGSEAKLKQGFGKRCYHAATEIEFCRVSEWARVGETSRYNTANRELMFLSDCMLL